jgi:MIP family channel proteins
MLERETAWGRLDRTPREGGNVNDDIGKAVVAEFVATFALVFVGAGAVIASVNGNLDLTGVALAHGLVLAIMVSVTAHISGGSVNPAVTFGLWVTGRLSSGRAIAYAVAELAGAVAAAYLLRFVIPGDVFDAAAGGGAAVASTVATGRAVLIEAAATFFLVFAVFGTAVDERGPFSKTAGLTIGLVIAFDIMAFGPWTGAAMNPARWFGPALATTTWDDWWVWVVGPLAGGTIGAVLYSQAFLRGREPVTP